MICHFSVLFCNRDSYQNVFLNGKLVASLKKDVIPSLSGKVRIPFGEIIKNADIKK